MVYKEATESAEVQALRAEVRAFLEENLPERAAKSGEYLLKNLKDLVQRFNHFCVEARGLGLLLAVEFNSDKVGYEVAKRLFDAGILVAGTLFKAKTIRFEPPLIITRKEIDFVLNTLEKVFKSIDKDLKKITKQDKPDYFK